MSEPTHTSRVCSTFWCASDPSGIQVPSGEMYVWEGTLDPALMTANVSTTTPSPSTAPSSTVQSIPRKQPCPMVMCSCPGQRFGLAIAVPSPMKSRLAVEGASATFM
eukprot:scaffold74818_cov73-Phaeocystis_antarctica.AAC.4